MSAPANSRKRREQESGFALLLVFVLAAVIAISLYMEMPRVAFEKQRDREQILVDRGHAYQRAIQLYYRKFGKYPASIDDLESTNNLRFLRRKYKDPMTGKDDWRLIHIGPGGFLTNSLVQKPPDPNKPQNAGNTPPGSAQGTGTQQANAQDPTAPNPTDPATSLNLATTRRPSDQMAGGAPGGQGLPADPNLQGQYPNQPYPYPSQQFGQQPQQQYPT